METKAVHEQSCDIGCAHAFKIYAYTCKINVLYCNMGHQGQDGIAAVGCEGNSIKCIRQWWCGVLFLNKYWWKLKALSCSVIKIPNVLFSLLDTFMKRNDNTTSDWLILFMKQWWYSKSVFQGEMHINKMLFITAGGEALPDRHC